jgi:hypothetical protein
MDTSFNIVDLIEKNPITKLSSSYNYKMLNTIKNEFTNFEQQLFVSSFYCYLNHDPKNDFVINLDDIWAWLGFNQKYNAKYLLEKNFKLETDYKNLIAPEASGAKKGRGGHNKEIIMLNVKTFKSFCLKAGTKKADEIHEYYLKMEDIIHQVVQEESDELKLQLEQKDKELATAQYASQRAAEQATISQFPRNTQCVYLGTTGNRSTESENLVKFGQTNDLQQRVYNHRGTFKDFILITAYRVNNSTEIENLIRRDPKIKKYTREIEINGKNYKEMIAYDEIDFTLERLTRCVKRIIDSNQYSLENFNTLLKQCSEQCIQIEKLSEDLKEIKGQNIMLVNDNERLRTTLEEQSAVVAMIKEEEEETTTQQQPYEQKFSKFIDEACILRHDMEESTLNLEGQYRLYSQTKPTKEIFHALKHYLDTRFKPQRLTRQDGNGVVYGYLGLKLKPIEYKKTESSDVENFIFQICRFSPSGKILNSTLLKEYNKWKTRMNKPITDNEIKELKTYLNASPHALKAVVWTQDSSNEGYYGISLKSDDAYTRKIVSSTGKKVEKRVFNTNEVVDTWATIAKAAESENMCATKMSRICKNKVQCGEFYYMTV